MNSQLAAVKQQWQQLQARFNALKPREQFLVTIAGVAILFALCDQLLWTPLRQSNKQLNSSIVNMQQQLGNLNTASAAVTVKLAEDPDAEVQRSLNDINAQLTQQNQRLTQLTVDLIQPEAMAGVLRKILDERKNLQLISLQNEPAVPAFTPRAETTGNDGNTQRAHVAIYRHGLTLELRGRYFDILDYLQVLEKLPWHFYWEKLDYKVDKYPDAIVTLKVYTLSNRESWIGA